MVGRMQFVGEAHVGSRLADPRTSSSGQRDANSCRHGGARSVGRLERLCRRRHYSKRGQRWLFVLFLPAAFIALAFAVSRRARRRSMGRREAHAASDGSDGLLRAELSVVADDVVRLEPQVALRPEARDDFEAATHRYRVAQVALENKDVAVDLLRVQRVVDEATWLMSRVRAILDGHQLPGPPSTLQTRGPRGEPAIELEDGDRPAYSGTRFPFTSGWFGIGGGLFGGLILGSIVDESSWVDDDEDPYGNTDARR